MSHGQPDTVELRGEGGASWRFRLPLKPAYKDQVLKGKLMAADAESAKTLAGSGVFNVEAQASGEAVGEGSTEEAATAPTGMPPKVGKGSGRDAWNAYAESIGIDASELSSRAEVIKAVEAQASGE